MITKHWNIQVPDTLNMFAVPSITRPFRKKNNDDGRGGEGGDGDAAPS